MADQKVSEINSIIPNLPTDTTETESLQHELPVDNSPLKTDNIVSEKSALGNELGIKTEEWTKEDELEEQAELAKIKIQKLEALVKQQAKEIEDSKMTKEAENKEKIEETKNAEQDTFQLSVEQVNEMRAKANLPLIEHKKKDIGNVSEYPIPKVFTEKPYTPGDEAREIPAIQKAQIIKRENKP